MNFLPSYKEIKLQFPLQPVQSQFIEKSRQTLRGILNQTNPKIALIVGPCSIHDIKSAKEFASLLKSLSHQVSSQFFLIMRVYCEKPRTLSGWKGFLYDPLLNGSHNILMGIEKTRQLLLYLASLQIPTATEFLDPLTAFYYDDLITWGSIGARTASSQIHRQLASDLSMPIGFKNGVAGNISASINGAIAASQSHSYIRLCDNGKPILKKSQGNRDAHIVLRGGESGPNYDPASVSHALASLEQMKLPSRLFIDCSHGNSDKKHDRQPGVFHSVIHQIIEGNLNIRGLMLESHLFAGHQPLIQNPSDLQYGISITDACLDWNATSQLISWGAQCLYQHNGDYAPTYPSAKELLTPLQTQN